MKISTASEDLPSISNLMAYLLFKFSFRRPTWSTFYLSSILLCNAIQNLRTDSHLQMIIDYERNNCQNRLKEQLRMYKVINTSFLMFNNNSKEQYTDSENDVILRFTAGFPRHFSRSTFLQVL